MNPAAALSSVLAVFRRRPADLLPMYILGAAVPAVGQLVLVLGLAMSYGYLTETGRLTRFEEALGTVDLEPPGPDAEVDAMTAWVEAITPLLELLFPPAVIAILGLSLLLAILVTMGLNAGVGAGQMATCYARLRDERGLTAGLAGIRRYWLTFLGLVLVEVALWLLVSGTALGLGILAFALHAIVGALVLVIILPVWLMTVLLIRAVFAFTPAAVVVEDVGVAGAIRASATFIRAEPASALIYYVVAIGLFGAFATLVTALSVLGMGRFVALGGLLLLQPGLDLFKTALYGAIRGHLDPPASDVERLRSALPRGLRRGLRETGGFVRGAPGLLVLAILITAVGFVTGWHVSAPYVGFVEASIAARLEGHLPPTAAMEFFGNNWTVAMTVVFGGVLFGIPSAFTLWFNGLLFGGYFRLEADLVELVAFVTPHGLLELPSIFIAGAVGLHLGWRGWRTVTGTHSLAAYADDLERAFWIVIGLGILLFVAGLIEGFVSPYYYRPFL